MKGRKLALSAALSTVVVAAVVLATGVAAGSAAKAATFKAAWIYVGPHNDGGWSQAHDAGRLWVQKSLGSKVVTTYKENIPEGPQVAQTIESLVSDGNKIIFGTSYGYQKYFAAAAKAHPDVKFEMATGTLQSKNLAEYYGAGEDSIYLSGMAAGAATKKGVVGYVAAFPIPEVIRHTNAFALGVQATHPGAIVKVVWTNSWFDLAKEKKAAQSLQSAGADVIGQNVDSPSAGQFAKSANLPWVGYDSELVEVRAEAVAHGGRLQLGHLLPEARQGRDGRDVEDGLLLRRPEGRLHEARALRPVGERGDEGRDRGEAEGDRRAARGTSSPGRSTTRRARSRSRRARRRSVTELYAMNWLVKGVQGSATG